VIAFISKCMISVYVRKRLLPFSLSPSFVCILLTILAVA
jgi:hypothetical protein